MIRLVFHNSICFHPFYWVAIQDYLRDGVAAIKQRDVLLPKIYL